MTEAGEFERFGGPVRRTDVRLRAVVGAVVRVGKLVGLFVGLLVGW